MSVADADITVDQMRIGRERCDRHGGRHRAVFDEGDPVGHRQHRLDPLFDEQGRDPPAP